MRVGDISSRLKIKVSTLDVAVIFLYLAVFKLYFLPDQFQTGLKIILLVLVLIFIVLHLRVKDWFNLSLVVVIPILLSCYYNYRAGGVLQELLNGTLHAICLYCLFSVLLCGFQRGRGERVIAVIYRMTSLYCCISVVSMIVLGRLAGTYWLGSKYMTSYYFILFLGLYYEQKRNRIEQNIVTRNIFRTMVLVFAFFAWYVGCITSMLAIFGMYGLSLLPKTGKELLSTPKALLIATLISAFLAIVMAEIMQLGFVRNFIVNVLHKSADLTDRLRYYAKIVPLLLEHNPLLGYGYNTDKMRSAIGLGTNIQNGLLQHTMNYGILGGLSCLFMLGKASSGSGRKQVAWGIYLVLYAMIICAIVEVSFNSIFFLAVFMLYWKNKYSEDIDGAVAKHKKVRVKMG